MSAAKRPDWLRWLAAQKHDLAGLTGTDVRVFGAIDAVWQLAPFVGLERVIPIARLLLALMQAKYTQFAIELVARSLDWDDRAKAVLLLQRCPEFPMCGFQGRIDGPHAGPHSYEGKLRAVEDERPSINDHLRCGFTHQFSSESFDQFDENTLEALALDMGEVCDQLDAEGFHEAAQDLRDQSECVVRDFVVAVTR